MVPRCALGITGDATEAEFPAELNCCDLEQHCTANKPPYLDKPELLEVTLDLAERREIRSAIRELRRKELERCEEALASKRFRSEKSNGQEDKENQPGPEMEEKQQRALRALAGRLEEINDLEELTALLRNSSEYEERKLIRAAIRKIRNDEIEGE
ncbi:unnamed protein product [Ranitomeya imitator]|uniref:Smoothelin domain-containing protein n=1 Tax=Ranitomeya imitator TaxID=111125 RepID=A0ABN9M8V9_9NEOB|nr:unnamed protein product [Ranitomeya imitator]